jgi:hypothetical protein
MAEPVRDPETGGRSLADILREAGIENPSRGRKRRWDDPDDVGLRQRRADADEQDRAARPAYGRRAGDLPVDPPAERPAPRAEQRPAEPPAARADDRVRARDDVRDTGGLRGRVRDRGRPGGGEDRRARGAPHADALETPADGPSTSAIPGLRTSQKPGVPTAAPAAAAAAAAPAATPAAAAPAPRGADPTGRGRRSATALPPSEPATGPIPVVGPDDTEDPAAGSAPAGPAAWLRFAGELVVAAAVGVGVYFAFTVLWEMLPHLAVVASPLVVTGLVAGVGAWRQRSGRGPVGIRLLALLVFAGTVLTILPAAGLLAAA